MSSIERAMNPGREPKGHTAQEPETQNRERGAGQGSAANASPGVTDNPTVELDFKELRHRGLITPEGGDARLEEEYRLAKRPLLKHAFPRGYSPPSQANMVLVSSASTGEGKTFTAFNLAMSIAMEMDHTVLLVDGDVTRNNLTRWLGMVGMPGITDVLDDPGLDLGRVIARTNLPKLRVIPSGKPHSRATELMASGTMERIADELSGRYPDRMVLFDSPPLLMASQTPVLANLVGQAVLVVEAGKTPQQYVQDALNLVDQSATKVGFLLNKTPRSQRSGYFGSY